MDQEAAIGFVIALKRQGLLDRPPSPFSPQRLIPTRITQFWDEKIPADVEALSRSFWDAL